MESLKRIYQIVRPTRKYMILIMVFSLISAAEMLLFPVITKSLINNAVSLVSNQVSLAQSTATFTALILAYAVIELLNSLNGTAETYYQTKFTALFEQLLRVKLFSHLTTLSVEFFENEKIGKTINKISRGINRASNLLQTLANWLLSQIIVYIAVLIIFFFLNVYIGLICLIVSILFLYISFKMTKKLKPIHKKINRKSDGVMGQQVEILSNISIVRNFAMEKTEVKSFTHSYNRLTNMIYFRAGKRLKYSTLRNLLASILTISALAISGYSVLKGTMTPGDIFLVQAYIRYIQWPLWNFAWLYDEASESMRSIEDIVKLLDKKPTVKDDPRAKKFLMKTGEVEFRNVSFTYKGKDNEPVFTDLTFKIKPGESIALVGPSGVGKSTIIKILGRLYDPQKGKVVVDGQNIKHVQQDSYRHNIGVVSQQSVLFNDTIENNIKYGFPTATEKQIIKAAKAANIHEFIMAMPKKYRTLVGERGVKLSGGEAQRVSIARAILMNPKILILDEATSSLDSQSEKLIQDALWKLIKGRTTVIIAHRLSTVMKADEILVLDEGKIVERGKHDDLIKSEGLYSELFNIQSGAFLLADGDESKIL